MAANRQGGDLKWQVLVNRLPVVVKILENPSTERKVAPASLESLKKLHDQAQALVNGQLVLPVTLDEPQRKEVDECVAGIARCLDKFPLHLLLEASQPKRAKVPLDEPATPAEGPAPLQRTASLPIPSGPATVVIPTSKSEGPPDKFGLGFSPPRSKLVVPADRGVEEVGWNPPEKFQKGFVPKHSDTGTTGLTSELLAPDGVVLHSPPMHGRTARPLGAFGGLGVASKPAFYHPGRTLPAEGGLEKENGHAAKLDQLSAPRLRGLDLADPGAQFGKSPPKSSVLSGGRAGHEEFWENGWTTIASRDLRAEIATAELDLLKESDEARAVRLQAEREAEAAAKIVRAREARQLYAGLDNGIERMQRGCAKAGAESSLRKESSSRSGEDSLSPHSSGAEADVDSQGLPGGYTDSGDKLALAGGDQRQHSFQSPRGGPSQGRALSPAARQRQQKLLLQRQLEEEGVQLELRIANGDHRPEAPKRARVPLGLSLWCSSGIEGGQEFAEGGSGSGQEDRDPSPQSPLAEKRNNVIGRQDWPEAGVLGLRKDEQHHKGGMALEAERSTPSPPVSLGLALQSGGRQNRMSNTDTLHGSVGQPLGSVGFARLELGTSRETSDVERGVKRHKDWQEDAWGRSRGAAGQPHQHVPNHPPEEERRKAGPREQAKRPRVEPSRGNLSPPPPRAANVPQKARGFDYPAALRSSVEAFLAHSSSGMSHEVGIGLNSSPRCGPPPSAPPSCPPLSHSRSSSSENPPPAGSPARHLRPSCQNTPSSPPTF
ncbi:hypothetical protein KFL_001080265 [Klebsormidium nitens]|uniref:Uncharacterized protein n=1 Tax=Klebsormidium nitens TaxID=105231 RepID=A0A1Y1HZI9_KLENI|nr:hypothetical protein KFL_001080265 [Klebsormidium nitens]|eukprot:GAQ82351.1 hypothetical protein KFL_001080265 [Klebsormidium nitens]